jgi:hypothetical protein
MSEVSANDLAFIKHDQTKFWPSDGAIYRKTMTPSALGPTYTETQIWTGKCRIGPIGDRRSESIYQAMVNLGVQDITKLHIGTFPIGTDVKIKDRVVIGTRTFTVTAHLTEESWETASRVYLNEVI